MPRTKIVKNSKRNRDEANREEKIRIYELKMDSVYQSADDEELRYKEILSHKLKCIDSRLQTELRNMKMIDFLELLCEMDRFSDYKASDQTQHIGSQSVCNMTVCSAINNNLCGMSSTNSRNDEGYLTEDSSLGGASVTSASTLSAYGASMRSAKALRTPGPLQSARARRERRSRSACNDISSAKPQAASAISKNSTMDSQRYSRSKMRTPIASRPKAISADRTPRVDKSRRTSPSTPPMALLRYPKPGEVALSKCGSPMVAQAMPGKFANVSIPIRNGVLSLQPKKLDVVKQDLLENLDTHTLEQIRTLHKNLELIMHSANQAGLK
ncbi:borr [Drosophila busckii]|uniref:Borr n=1 Tax=Drosophila busckii TaxID=30019 RepID=A0A0M4E1Y8_DROBS|nr:borr [Drosophila busckii]